MLRNILLPVLILIAITGSSQTGSVDGFITGNAVNDPLPGAIVQVVGTAIHTTSNSEGYFFIDGIPSGTNQIEFRFLGFESARKQVNIGSGKNITLHIRLLEVVNQLGAVEIMSGGSSGLKDIPGSVQYISPKEMERFSYTDINRVLRAVPGINMQEEDGFGLRPNIGLRATGSERSSKITLMEDGVLIAPAPYAAPAAYYFPTVGRMYAVEILKGSSQIKYGPYTTGGAINLLSTPIPSAASGRVSMMYGSFNTKEIRAQVGSTEKQLGYSVEVMNYASDGFKSLPSGDPTGFNKADYLGKLQWKSKADAPVQHDILLKAGLAEEESNETYLGLTQSDFESNPFARYAGSNEDLMATEQSQLTLTHRISLPKGWNVTTTAYRTDFHRNWYKLDKVRTDSGAVGISAILDAPDRYGTEYAILTGINTTGDEALLLKANNRTYYAQGVQSKIEYRLHGEETEHHFEVGARIHEDQIDRFQWVDEYDMDNGIMELAESGTPGTESNRIETATAFAGYVNYKLSAGRTSLHPGARLENVSVHRRDFGKEDPDRTGSSLSERTNRVIAIMPGIAVNHELSTHTSLFMGVHKGFAPPGSKEGTDPESSVNYELGTRIHHSRLSSEAVVFFSDYANLLGVDLAASGGTGSTSLFNGGAAQAYGLEFQLTYQLLKPSSRGATMPLTVVYTFSDAYFENSFNSEFEGWGSVEAGDHLPYMAPHQFTIITSYERDDYSFSISGKYASEMRTVPGQESPVRSQSTDAFFTVDAAVDIRISSGISFFASGTNLTDEVYVVARRPAGARPGMPRSIRLGIKARF